MSIFDDIKNSLLGEEEEEKIIEKKVIATPKKTETVTQTENTEQTSNEQAPKNVYDFKSSAAFNRENSASRQNIQQKYSKAEIKTIKPKTFNDAQTVANLLRDNIAVIMNLEETDPAESQRIVDFIGGTTYAIEGKMRPISPKVFICAPTVVTVESYEEEKRAKGTFFD
jgi:cell division inhibitor SepF